MANHRTDYYYMTYEERRAYHRKKDSEYRERKAILRGYTLKHHDPNSHPSRMTHDELLSYNRKALREHKERLKIK